MPRTAQQSGRRIASSGTTGLEAMRTGAGGVALIGGAIVGEGRGKILIRAVSFFGTSGCARGGGGEISPISFFGSAMGGMSAQKMAQMPNACHSENAAQASRLPYA